MNERHGKLASIGELIAEKNIELVGFDPISRGGFTQIPNFILKNASLSIGAKLTYALFLHYAWNSGQCFPGQDTLGEAMGMSKSRANEFIKELERAGLVEIQRRGQGKTNLYKIKFTVKQKSKRSNS